MNNTELVVFIIYLLFMLGIGVHFFIKTRDGGEKTYFLGGREMGPWVSALSAGASDMSAWVLMGLPASIYVAGLGKAWIAIGLAVGYALSWLLIAPRLRRYSIAAKDSITVPQFLTNRFLSASRALQIISAVIFIVAYTIYAASSLKACGSLFETVLDIDGKLAMYISAVIIIGYTFLGGFSAVCWTDFFQGMLMLAALLAAPIFALGALKGPEYAQTVELGAGYWKLFTNAKDVLSGLAWGLGYFGMPHIIVRFMAIKGEREVKQSAVIGISWNVLIVIFSVAAGCIGRRLLGDSLLPAGDIDNSKLVFINMVRKLFPSLICGILLSAILAASMSTADSQLLASASAFASDVYKPVFRKNKASDKEMMWAGRLIVLAISAFALVIASNPKSGTIMDLVENAWGVFGASFGPAIVLALFWRRLTFKGAVAGVVAGAAADILWLAFLSSTGLYELLPAFAIGLAAAVIVSLIDKAPAKDVTGLFDQVNGK